MHLPDALLLRLIGSDQLGNENTTAEEHLAECSTCQSRLAQMSGDSRELQSELSHLRSASQHELELVRSVSGVSIEPGSPSSAARVEVELVDLGFLESPKHPELLGRLGRYDVEKTIGSGGMGIVLKAFDGELNRVVAIKVLAPHLANSGAARARFSREARAAAAVLHPNVLPIFNVESEGRIPYFVMQYIAGQSLQTRVDREGPLDICTALRIAKQTASALQAAHTQG
ncbi:MAG: serine/threonine protein kinase, partial [Planctomycetales bacterium]|nr:serine/threonine protein kinase [Planctomycetales bacterium]